MVKLLALHSFFVLYDTLCYASLNAGNKVDA